MLINDCERPVVSIIIAAYNSKGTIRQCLESLYSQELGGDSYEIIVVDSSEDETPQIIRECFPDIKLVQLQSRAYPGTARNIAIEQARGGIIAFIDSDCLAAKGWLAGIIKAHRSDYMAIGGSILNGWEENRISWTEYFLSASEYFPSAPRRSVRTIPTCNISYKREVFEKYGLFSETLAAFEDVLFNERLVENGQPILFEPGICVHHLYRQSLSQLITRVVGGGRSFRQASCIYKTKGWSLARIPFLTPMFPLVKVVLIASRMVRWNRPLLPVFLSLLPLMFLCLGASTYGILLEGIKRSKPGKNS